MFFFHKEPVLVRVEVPAGNRLLQSLALPEATGRKVGWAVSSGRRAWQPVAVVEDGGPRVWALQDLERPEEERALQPSRGPCRPQALAFPAGLPGCCRGLANDYQETCWHARTFGERGLAAGGGCLCVQSLACDVTTLS